MHHRESTDSHIGTEVPEANRPVYRIALVNWSKPDENAAAIQSELALLGHESVPFHFNQPLPCDVDVIFTFAPYGRLYPIVHQLQEFSEERRPHLIHWNFESLPDINLPWVLLSRLSALRSWVERLSHSHHKWVRTGGLTSPIAWVNRRMHKLRYVGDAQYAHRQGLLTMLCESSQIFADLLTRHNLPAKYVPWGISTDWYADLGLERDIDVIWMGKRRTQQRAKMLHEVRDRLSKYGLTMYIADDIENPFVYGSKRTELLNRAKITLNIPPTWYDPGFQFRFSKAAANRSMVVSTPILPHVPICQQDRHYVSAQPEHLIDTILHYLHKDSERQEITEQAYQLVTRQLTLANSVRAILDEFSRVTRSGP